MLELISKLSLLFLFCACVALWLGAVAALNRLHAKEQREDATARPGGKDDRPRPRTRRRRPS